MSDGADGIGVALLILAFVTLFIYIGYDAGYKSGEVNILSGKTPTFHLTTNSVGEINWSRY